MIFLTKHGRPVKYASLPERHLVGCRLADGRHAAATPGEPVVALIRKVNKAIAESPGKPAPPELLEAVRAAIDG